CIERGWRGERSRRRGRLRSRAQSRCGDRPLRALDRDRRAARRRRCRRRMARRDRRARAHAAKDRSRRDARDTRGAVSSPAVVWSKRYSFDWPDHVFPTAKYRLAFAALRAEELGDGDWIEPGRIARDELLLAHTRRFIDEVEQLTAD